MVRFDFISVTLYDETSNTLRSHALETVKGPGFLLPPNFPPESSITWWIYHHQQPMIVPSTERETRFPLAMDVHKKYGVRSSCLLPLTTVHRRLGAISFGSMRPHTFSDEEVRFLTLVAEQIAVAIDDALNFEALRLAQTEVQRQNDRLQLILELTNRFVSKSGAAGSAASRFGQRSPSHAL